MLFRLPRKKQLPVRASDVVVRLLDPLRHRAGDTGCGDVSRDELVAALLVAADEGSDEELRKAVEAYRQKRVADVPSANRGGLTQSWSATRGGGNAR